MVRDLQLPEAAKHASVLRPLPGRARLLNAWGSATRRHFLGITPLPHAKKL